LPRLSLGSKSLSSTSHVARFIDIHHRAHPRTTTLKQKNFVEAVIKHTCRIQGDTCIHDVMIMSGDCMSISSNNENVDSRVEFCGNERGGRKEGIQGKEKSTCKDSDV
jgi:hypothetical protein